MNRWISTCVHYIVIEYIKHIPSWFCPTTVSHLVLFQPSHVQDIILINTDMDNIAGWSYERFFVLSLWCHVTCSPQGVSIIKHKVLHVTLTRAEEVAGVLIWVGYIWPMVTVAVTSIISVAGIQTTSVTINWDQVVNCWTPTPEIKDQHLKIY